MEELKHRVTAKAKKIERYDGRLKQYRENTQFQNNQQLFYTSLGENAEWNKLGPCTDDVKILARNLGSLTKHNENTSWIKDICKETQGKQTL